MTSKEKTFISQKFGDSKPVSKFASQGQTVAAFVILVSSLVRKEKT
jgi:hypothetical protein